MSEDPRIQIYRTAIDSLLTWMCLVSSALDRKLFTAADIEEVGYWVAKIESKHLILRRFIDSFGYATGIDRLVCIFRKEKTAYQNSVFPINTPSWLEQTRRPAQKETAQELSEKEQAAERADEHKVHAPRH